MRFGVIVAVVIAALAVVFALLNANPVGVNLGFGGFETPLAVLIIGTLAAGVLIGFFAGSPARYKLNKEVKELKAQVKDLKTLPTPPEESEIAAAVDAEAPSESTPG